GSDSSTRFPRPPSTRPSSNGHRGRKLQLQPLPRLHRRPLQRRQVRRRAGRPARPVRLHPRFRHRLHHRDGAPVPDQRPVKRRNPNVRVAVSLGGATVNGRPVFFNVTSSVDSWVRNAVDSLTGIIWRYGLDGIDIDYEQFQVDPATFAECAGRLVAALKSSGVIRFASIAPYGNADVQRYYRTLWAAHGAAIDYVNFQFYAYGASTTAAKYVSLFDEQIANYPGANILASFTTAATNTSVPVDTALSACRTLQGQGKLYGIFAWAADHSRNQGFKYETESQALLTDATTY
uniref:GH18 domain-containing protein n=1 Tax=Aegilops tauschii subsp. strangulata TaxID=200361 RepID=A0A452YBE2_AEGTS